MLDKKSVNAKDTEESTVANISFMQKKFSLETLVNQYLQEIKKLKAAASSPLDEQKLQTYYQAANTFKRLSVKDLVQFALSFGRNSGSAAAQMREALPILLGNRVMLPNNIDLEYARLLLEYAKGFQKYKGNLSNWMLRFVLNSRFSPIHSLVEREIASAIAATEQKITIYQATMI